MAEIRVEFDKKAMADIQQMLASSDDFYNKVAFQAMRKVVAGVKTDTDTEIRSVYNLKKAKVSSGIFTTIGTRQSPNFSVQVGRRGVESAQPIGLINFGAKENKSGVTVQVMASGARKPVTHAFKATGPKGGTQVFMRKYRKERQGPFIPQARKIAFAQLPRKYRLPIWKLTGPRLADAFKDDKSSYDNVRRKAAERMRKEVGYQLDMAFARYR